MRRLALLALFVAACSSENAVAPAVTPGADTGASIADAKADTTTTQDAAVPDTSVAEAAAETSGDVLLADASDATCANCEGAPFPTWQLADFQPKSPRYGQTYGLEEFRGKVTVVALLSGW